MMTNRSRTVLYAGVTNSLERRIWFHRNNTIKSFTKQYKVDRLVYYEAFDEARDAISREKQIKGWRREKKNDLVRTLNPKWKDLGLELFDAGSGEVTRRDQCDDSPGKTWVTGPRLGGPSARFANLGMTTQLFAA